MSNQNWSNGGRIYTPYVKPVLLTCNFVVDSTNANGLGVSSLKGGGFDAVFMRTSATPGSQGGLLNPNPLAGYIIVNTQGNYSRYLGGFNVFASPNSGTPLTSVTATNVYTITALGTATLTQWQTRGLPIGITPAIGVTFTATTTGTIGGSAAVQAPLAAGSGIDHIEVIGNANTSLGGVNNGVPTGAFITLACFKNTVLTAPTNGSTISLSFWFNDSQVLLNGQ